MIRTKDFVVILIAGMLATIGAGFFFISGDAPPRMVETEEGFFLEPQGGYTVVSHTQTDENRTRDAFIESVRRAYVPQESPEPEPTPVVIEPYIPVSPTPEIVIPAPNPEPEILPFPTSTPSAHMSTTTATSSEESVSADPSI